MASTKDDLGRIHSILYVPAMDTSTMACTASMATLGAFPCTYRLYNQIISLNCGTNTWIMRILSQGRAFGAFHSTMTFLRQVVYCTWQTSTLANYVIHTPVDLPWLKFWKHKFWPSQLTSAVLIRRWSPANCFELLAYTWPSNMLKLKWCLFQIWTPLCSRPLLVSSRLQLSPGTTIPACES